MSVARFIGDQRSNYRVPHTITCALLGVGVSWFYKWLARAGGDGVHTDTDRRRVALDDAVRTAFTAAEGLHGSPRLVADLRDEGWTVSEKTVADSMRRQGLIARKIRRRGGLTRQDRTAPKFPDLLKRDFTAAAPNCKWVGDMTEIPTESGRLYLLVTWNHGGGRLFVPWRHHELRGPVHCVGDLGGELAGPGPARAGGGVVADLGRSGAGSTHDRRVCARPGGVSAGL